jgi:hypothetical protein
MPVPRRSEVRIPRREPPWIDVESDQSGIATADAVGGLSGWSDEITKAGLGTAKLQSYDGEFLLPTPESIAAAAAALGPRTPVDERLTLVNAPGVNAYPLINYEYAIC